jgi:hypothetical protein
MNTTSKYENREQTAKLDLYDAPEGYGMPHSFRSLSAIQAGLLLDKLSANPHFQRTALQRGSPEASARVWLTAKMNGRDLSDAELGRMASGEGPDAAPSGEGDTVFS